MRYNVSEAGQIDLVRCHYFTKCRLSGKYRLHQAIALVAIKVGHFTDMLVKNDSAKSGIVLVRNADDPAKVILPQQVSAIRMAQLAIAYRQFCHVAAFSGFAIRLPMT